jgi:hypothetical protein
MVVGNYGASWPASYVWSDTAFPILEVTPSYRYSASQRPSSEDDFVVVLPGHNFTSGYEFLARNLNGSKIIYRFDGYKLVADGNLTPIEVLSNYLVTRADNNKSLYMYIEFFDLDKNDGHAYHIYTVNGESSHGAMIIPLVPPSAEKLALRRRLKNEDADAKIAAMGQFVRGAIGLSIALGIASMANETMIERMAREHDECVRANAFTATGGTMC